MIPASHSAACHLPSTWPDGDVQALILDEALAYTAIRQGGHQGDWQLQWLFDYAPDPANLTARLNDIATQLGFTLPALDWSIDIIKQDTDWLAESYRAPPPLTVGPFFIHGSHHTGTSPEGLLALQIEAATAFGSGEHGTTKGCLQAMLDLKGAGICPWNVLDMGTGSGILALAAWKLWKTPILATDIDAESIRVTRRHADENGVKVGQGALRLQAGDGFAAPLVNEKAPYELIIANILAGPVIDFAQDLVKVLDDPGYVILSGMLQDQAEDVLSAYTPHGLKLRDRYDIGDWSTLALGR